MVIVGCVVEVGEICVAEHEVSEELTWGRTAVISHSRPKRFQADRPRWIECFFLDEGKQETVDLKEIRPIEKSFLEFPIQVGS